MRSRVLQLYIKKQKNDEVIFSLAWNIMFTDNWKVLVLDFLGWKIWYFWAKKLMEIYLLITEKFLFWSFREWKIRPFFESRIDRKMIFTGYWKVLVLKFSGMGNTVFCSAKKLMKKWYLLGLFELSMTFQYFGNMVFRAVK